MLGGAALAAWAGAAAAAARRREALEGYELDDAVRPAEKPLRLLILGGTGFLGPATVEYARARGHRLTLFHRGRTNPHLFPEIEKLHGDRDPRVGDGLSALEGREWDAVIDNSGYVPRHVAASAELLSERVRRYLFVSSVSVYADFSQDGIDEESPVARLEDPAVEEITGATYGALKALCEEAAEAALPGRVAVVRPTLIVGPRDPSDRFTFWPVRIERGGEVLCPGAPLDPVQYVDVRDLAAFLVTLIERETTGVFNATGPTSGFSIGELLFGCKAVLGGDARWTFVPAEFLAEHGVRPWTQMPVWVPPVGESRGMGTVSGERARAAGLRYRPFARTVEATLAWWHAQPDERRERLRAGITPEREAEVLGAWRARPR